MKGHRTKSDGILKNPHKPRLKKTPAKEIPIPETANITPKQETIKMDIHANHLHHAPGNKGWHYFFEFLMLFLAVFCGFLAENYHVQLMERHHEKEFIKSIVEDIKSDTLESEKIIKRLNTMHTGIDSILIELASPGIIKNSNKAFRLWNQNMGLETFVSNDRTIQQLKSNGELRLIRNKAVSDRIMKYDQLLKKYYTQSNLMYNAMSNQTYYSQLFDAINLTKNPSVPAPLTEQGKKDLNHAYSNLSLWNRGLTGLISWLEVVNEEGKSLVVFIKKEYHLEEG